MFSPFMIKARPDQFCHQLNEMETKLEDMGGSIRILSEDRKNVIIIGNQPVNPQTGKPYSFGIHTYKILGDRLEEVQ